MRYKSASLRSIAGLLGASALCACATLPPDTPARIAKAPQTYATAQSLTAPERAWPADDWWTAYGDSQLNGLMGEALSGSPSLAVAQARVRKAEASEATLAAAIRRSAPTPRSREEKQSYNNGIPPDFVPQGYNGYGRLSLDFNWELDFWGKNRAAVAALTSQTRAAEADAAEARLMLSTNVAAAYADLARLYAERDVAEPAPWRSRARPPSWSATAWPTASTPWAANARPRPSPCRPRPTSAPSTSRSR